jgi:hypothetical protein
VSVLCIGSCMLEAVPSRELSPRYYQRDKDDSKQYVGRGAFCQLSSGGTNPTVAKTSY